MKKSSLLPSEKDNIKGYLLQAHLAGTKIIETTLGRYKVDPEGDIVLLIDEGVAEEIVRVKRI